MSPKQIGRPPTVLPEAEIVEKYVQGGRSLRSLSLTYGVAYTTIRNMLLRNGVTLRASGGRPGRRSGWQRV